MTEIILKQDVENLGETGEVVDVAAGYARNYLLPQGLALPADEGNLKRIREERRREERAAERVREEAESLASTLEGKSLTFHERAGEGGQLFGSVTAADVIDRLASDGIELDRRNVLLEEPIKELGVYSVAVDLHADVRPEVKVWVVAEE